MNNDTFLIENDSLEVAQDICKYIENDTVRSRSVANAFAAIIAKKYFNEIDVDIDSGLYKNCKVLEDIEIADIYIKNNYIDVRIYFSDNELCVPKANFDREILPLAYMFIKLDKDLSNGNVTGFILPSMVDKSKDYNGYYRIDESDLISYYDVEAMLAEGFVFDIDEDFNAQIYDFLDNKVDNKNYFYRVLLSSKEARELLQKAIKASIMYNFVSKTKDENETDFENIEEQNTILEVNVEQELNQNTDEMESSDENIEFENLEEYSLEDNDLILDESENLEEDLLEELPQDETLDDAGFDSNEEFLESTDSTKDLEVLEENTEEDFDIITAEAEEVDLLDNSEVESDDLVFNDTENTLIEEEDLTEEEVAVNEDLNIVPDIDTNLDDEVNIETTDSNEDIDNLDLSEDNEANLVENNDFDFSTNITPSINSIEDSEEENIADKNEIEELVFEETTSVEAVPEEQNSDNNAEELETLFKDLENEPQNASVQEQINDVYSNTEPVESDYNNYYSQKSNKGPGIVPVLGIITLIAAAGYFGYTKYFNQQEVATTTPIKSELTTAQNIKKEVQIPAKKEVVDAMPIETVEKEVKLENKNEGLAVEIPAIEKNLDASILVSNLSIQWEVPAGYATNNTAKRYFTKMGKIIQLNLKTEMLLLNKPPITNKIVVELEFNKSLNKFKVKGIVASSGENTVDELIKKTVQNALDINLSMNMNVFNNIPGNPSLVIRL